MTCKPTYLFSLSLAPFFTIFSFNISANEKIVIPPPTGIYEEVYVTGGKDQIRTLSGSAALIDEEAIDKFEVTDLNALLTEVPGIYITQEDGFGLRPNIGLRGTETERSTKITMMEDGILIGPAPYSAPAAYYVPNINRMSNVEVFKGPAAIEHGPHTVGGAINFITRPISDSNGELGLTMGDYGYHKVKLFYGDNQDRFGYWVDVLRYGADGFKELDSGADTGFVRNDFNTKLQFRSSSEAGVYQELEVKLGYADEDSNETYLGLSDDDFYENPNRRYAASELDRFVSEHSQVHLLHSADFRNSFKLVTRVYQNKYHRSWNKFAGLINGRDIRDILASPNIFENDMDVLRGFEDTPSIGSQRIDITDNDRRFSSQGIESRLSYSGSLFGLDQEFVVGFRFHNDWVKREHLRRGYLMQGGHLFLDAEQYSNPEAVNLNKGETDALAVFFREEVSLDKWTLNVGMRYENIHASFVERVEGAEVDRTGDQEVVLPGVGAFYQMTDTLGVLVGINKGFSPKSPSAAEEVKPEESTNYEYGLRYVRNDLHSELIGFYGDYTNRIGRCRASDECAGEEFNAGESIVNGVEFSTRYVAQLGGNWEAPISLVYTYTAAEFRTSFDSPFWGDVNKGDSIPYLPEQIGRLDLGLQNEKFSVSMAMKFTGKIHEQASKTYEAGEYTEALTVYDLAFAYDLYDDLSLKLVVENITDEQEIVSRRPYGARPNQPRTMKANVSYEF